MAVTPAIIKCRNLNLQYKILDKCKAEMVSYFHFIILETLGKWHHD